MLANYSFVIYVFSQYQLADTAEDMTAYILVVFFQTVTIVKDA
ncbi:MAG: hypothetical protein RMZ69_22580 [Nostoc sp. ChiQUE01a]|nr:hypothetical protein [Nostoc sp. ChiQUE01a]